MDLLECDHLVRDARTALELHDRVAVELGVRSSLDKCQRNDLAVRGEPAVVYL